MATPPKTPTGTPTPPRRRSPARKPATPAAPPASEAEGAAEKAAETKPRRGRPPAAAAADKAPAKRTPRAKSATTRKPAQPRTATGRAGKAVTDTAKSAGRAAKAPVQLVSDTRERVGNTTFFAGLIGGLAAAGAAVTGVLLANRSRRAAADPNALNPGAAAHQVDGSDSSRSFEAGIADESTIPDKID